MLPNMEILNRRFNVISAYESTTNSDPIILEEGDQVVLKEKSEELSQWENWICCISQRTGKEGWVPAQILEINIDRGVSLTNYSANELTVELDELLIAYKELNGWIWASRLDATMCGWVPLENLIEI